MPCFARGRSTPPPNPLPETERGRKPLSAPPLRFGEGVGGRGSFSLSPTVAAVAGADQLDAAWAEKVLDLTGGKCIGVDPELPSQPQSPLLAVPIDDAQPDRTGPRIALQHLGDAVDQVLPVLAQPHPQPHLVAGLLLHLLDAEDLR